MIREAIKSDAHRIAELYNYYIRKTIVTFDEQPLSITEMENKISVIQEKGYPFIVYELDNTIVAYAYLNNWRNRSAFNITLETSIYVDNRYQQKGIGMLLYNELIKTARQLKLHSLVAAVSLPNEASRKIHSRLGFKLVGNFKESGLKFGKLIDVEFWQLFL